MTLLVKINHNKFHNILLQKDYIPGRKTAWLYHEIYQDAEGTQIMDVKKREELTQY